MGGNPIWINCGQENLIPLAPSFNRETAYRSRDASKGGAIKTLKELLRFERVICFGDINNDLSMFEATDEGYAPANANDAIISAATGVIGHHDEKGIARFLRERFSLDVANG